MNPGASDGSSTKRAWLAVLLSFLIPGIGHVYLREWLRAAFWFLTILLAGNLLIPASAVPEQGSVFDVMLGTYEAAPMEAKLALIGLTAMCMGDAYWLATRGRPSRQQTGEGDEQPHRCPNCGKEVDEDLDFCHWCSAELTGASGSGDAELTAGELNEQSGEFEGDLTGGPEDEEDDEVAEGDDRK